MSSAAEYVAKLAARADATPGDAYKYEHGAAVDTITKPSVCEEDMSVRMLISTDCVDRERMVIAQDGIDISLYRANPVVLYGHGEEGIVTPVAISEDKAGNCTVERGEKGTYATAYHTNKDKISSQMFDLVCCGLLRASSVGVTPKSVSYRYSKDGDKIAVIDECYLNEWSYCTVGVNPQSIVAKQFKGSPEYQEMLDAYALQSERLSTILSRNTLDGSSIHPVIKRSLIGLRDRLKSGVLDMPKSLTRQQIKKMNGVQLAKSLAKMMDYDSETVKMLRDEAKMMKDEYKSYDKEYDDDDMESDDDSDEVEVEEEVTASMDSEDDMAASGPEDVAEESSEEVEAEEPAGDEKPGAAAIKAGHADLMELISKLEASAGATENPGVVKGLQKEIDRLNDSLMSMEALFKAQYPDASPIGGGDEPEVGEQQLKSWLAGDSRRKARVTALAGRLDVWARRIGEGSISKEQLSKSLKRASVDMDRIEKSVAEMSQASFDDSFLERFSRVEEKVLAIAKHLDSTPA